MDIANLFYDLHTDSYFLVSLDEKIRIRLKTEWDKNLTHNINQIFKPSDLRQELKDV